MHSDLNPQQCRQELEREPANPQLWLKLGLAYFQQQRLTEAQQALRQGLAVDPQFLPLHYYLGLILEFAQSWHEAQQAYLGFIKRAGSHPFAVEALCNLGRIAQQQGHFAQALAYYTRVLSWVPRELRTLNQIGIVCFQLNQLELAQVCFQGILSLPAPNPQRPPLPSMPFLTEPESPEALKTRLLNFSPLEFAQFLALPEPFQTQKRPATEQLLPLLRNSRFHLEALTNWVGILEKQTRFQEVLELVQPLIQPLLQTDHPLFSLTAHYARACLHQGQSDLLRDWLPQVLSTWESQSPHNPQLRPLYFVLGEMAEQEQDQQQAFAYFSRGNALARSRFDRHKFQHNIHNLLTAFSPEFMARLPRLTDLTQESHPQKQPQLIFIVGMPRSGTTLVEQILASHSQVYGGGELPFMGQIWGQQQQRMGSTAIAWQNYFASLSPAELAPLAKRYYQDIQKHSPGGCTHFCDKMPGNLFYLPLMALLFPQAKYILVQRNALDTCWSCFKQDFSHLDFARNLQDLGVYYSGCAALMQQWQEGLGVPTFPLHYEQLVQQNKTSVRDLLAFCGLNWEDECLHFYRNQRPVYTASYAQVRRPIYSDSLGRAEAYRDYLAPLIESLQAIQSTRK